MHKTFLGVNADQALSLINHGIGIVAAFMLAHGIGQDWTDLATGSFLAAFSTVIGIWMNGDNIFDAVSSTIRKVLTMVFAFTAARGWLSEQVGVAVMNTIGTMLPIIWAMIFYSDKPGPALPGTTVVDKGATP
jgi:hypothetical protein